MSELLGIMPAQINGANINGLIDALYKLYVTTRSNGPDRVEHRATPVPDSHHAAGDPTITFTSS